MNRDKIEILFPVEEKFRVIDIIVEAKESDTVLTR